MCGAVLTRSPDDAQQDYNNIQQSDNTASFGHEAVAGGAAFFAMHEFEKHQRAEGMSSLQAIA